MYPGILVSHSKKLAEKVTHWTISCCGITQYELGSRKTCSWKKVVGDGMKAERREKGEP